MTAGQKERLNLMLSGSERRTFVGYTCGDHRLIDTKSIISTGRWFSETFAERNFNKMVETSLWRPLSHPLRLLSVQMNTLIITKQASETPGVSASKTCSS
jgi:hypothetical protein